MPRGKKYRHSKTDGRGGGAIEKKKTKIQLAKHIQHPEQAESMCTLGLFQLQSITPPWSWFSCCLQLSLPYIQHSGISNMLWSLMWLKLNPYRITHVLSRGLLQEI